MRDECEMCGSFMNELYSGGNGGRGLTSENFDPFGPQQKPEDSPVRRIIPQVVQEWVLSPRFSPHWSRGEVMAAICQVSLISF
jgi:hypothetical protein